MERIIKAAFAIGLVMGGYLIGIGLGLPAWGGLLLGTVLALIVLEIGEH